MKMTNKSRTVNTKWFRERLSEQHMSGRTLAKHLNLDASAVSLMLRGRRTMKAEEANQISSLLRIPVTEVLSQAGIPVEEDARCMRIAATVDARGFVAADGPEAVLSVFVPREVPADGIVAQVRDSRAVQDRWVLCAGAPDTELETHIDQLGIIELEDGQRVVGLLRRGYGLGRFNIVPLLESPAMNNLTVRSIARVLWIKPS